MSISMHKTEKAIGMATLRILYVLISLSMYRVYAYTAYCLLTIVLQALLYVYELYVLVHHDVPLGPL